MSEDTFAGLQSESIEVGNSEQLQASKIVS